MVFRCEGMKRFTNIGRPSEHHIYSGYSPLLTCYFINLTTLGVQSDTFTSMPPQNGLSLRLEKR